MEKNSNDNANENTSLQKLINVIAFLRTDSEGCAWTKEQTHQSITPHLIEECYETAEAIDLEHDDDQIRDELGDILLQVVFHAQIAKERGSFTFEDIAQSIVNKLERRYPTILGTEPNTLKTAEEICNRWEEVKALERKAKGLSDETSILDNVSFALPALKRASKLKERASKAGWEWPDVSMLLDKINEEIGELKVEIEKKEKNKERIAAEFGDLLFMLVDFARWHDIDAEDALRITNNRFERRFRYMETHLRKQGKELSNIRSQDCIALWNEAKNLENN